LFSIIVHGQEFINDSNFEEKINSKSAFDDDKSSIIIVEFWAEFNKSNAFTDWNKIQGSGFVDDILPIDSLENVAVSCGWEVAIIDGHNNEEILNSLKFPRPEKPYMIIAETVKGKGVSYMENNPKWHANWPDIEHENIAIEELQ